MGVAKDKAAVTTMVPSLKEGEGFLADWGVADKGVCVWLPVLACGQSGHCGQIVFSYSAQDRFLLAVSG